MANLILNPSQFAQALKKQRDLSDTEWLKRCDELAVQQPVLFPELVCFMRDGVPENLGRRLIDYLSVLQFVARDISESVAAPVLLPEFEAATEKMMKLFYAITTDDPAYFNRMIEAFFKGVMAKSDPMIWAGCVEALRSSGMQEQPLYPSICCTLATIAEVYAQRVGKG